MKEIVDVIYIGTTINLGVECDVWEHFYSNGEVWYELIPTVDEEYEAYLDELFFRCF